MFKQWCSRLKEFIQHIISKKSEIQIGTQESAFCIALSNDSENIRASVSISNCGIVVTPVQTIRKGTVK